MEELENETIEKKNIKQLILKPLAFEEIKNKIEEDKQIENSSNENSKSDNLSYNDLDFALAREFSGLIRENNPIRLLTTKIVNLYKKCQSDYIFEEIEKPKRELTIPNEGVYNDNLDNIEHDLIVCMDDVIKGPNCQYTILDLLGSGISGQVFKCKSTKDEKLFALKIIKNKKAHNCQALIELRILEFLNNKVDVNDCYHIIRKFDHFYYKNHLCIVFELLNENLYELLKQNYFQGLSLNSIRFILKQILEALLQLQKADLIHCDLKPENILLKIEKEKENKHEILIKVTDFGSACFKDNTFFSYIQSRYYRAPETIIGYPYSVEIDMWSLGCIAAELYLGEPLFPGSSEYDQLCKIVNFIEDLPLYMLKLGKNTKKYYNLNAEKDESRKLFGTLFKLKPAEEFFAENPKVEKPKYLIPSGLTSLDDILKLQQQQQQSKKNLNQSNTSVSVSDLHFSNNNVNNNNNNNLNNTTHNQSNLHNCSQNDLEAFVHFLKGLLTIDPKKRWNAKTALRHPFILKEKFNGNFHIEQNDEISLFINNETIDNNNSVISDGGFNYNNNQQQRFLNAANFGNFTNNTYKNMNIHQYNLNHQANNYNICMNADSNCNGNNNFYSNNPNSNFFNIGSNNSNNFNNNNNNRFLNINSNVNSNNRIGFPNNNFCNFNSNSNNNKNCQSMFMNFGIPSSNDTSSLNSNSFNNQLLNSSMDYSCYQPNICNIPLNMLKNFPYGKIDDIDLKNSNKKGQLKNKNNLDSNQKNNFKNNKFNKNYQVKCGQNQNQTFTTDNFNKLGNNHSFTHDNYIFNSNSSNYHNKNYNVIPNINQACSNFANMNLGNTQINTLNTSNNNRSFRGNFNNNNHHPANNNLLNNSNSNVNNQEDMNNNSGNFNKNLLSTPSKFNQNLNNSYNLNLSYNSNINNPSNNNFNVNSNFEGLPIEKRTSDQGQGSLSYFRNYDNNSSMSYREYEDLRSFDENFNNKHPSNRGYRGRSYSDYYENNKIINNNFNSKSNFLINTNTNANLQNFIHKGYSFNKFNSSQNNNGYFNKNLNNVQSNSQKFNKKNNKKNMSSQNTPVINNKSHFHDDVSNKSDMFFSTDEIKEEIDEEINANINNNFTGSQNNVNTIEEINND